MLRNNLAKERHPLEPDLSSLGSHFNGPDVFKLSDADESAAVRDDHINFIICKTRIPTRKARFCLMSPALGGGVDMTTIMPIKRTQE